MSNRNILSIIALGVLIFVLFVACDDKKIEKKEFKIGIVTLTDVDNSTIAGFKEKMEQLGWIEGENVSYVSKGPAEKIENLDIVINSILADKVDMIYVASTPATIAVKKATESSKLPVVFAPVNDPISSGIVHDLKNHNSHIVGVKLPESDRQRMLWLNKVAPKAKNILIPYTPGDKSSEYSRKEASEAARVLGLNIIEKSVIEKDDIDEVIKTFPDGIDAIYLPRDSSIESLIEHFVTIAHNKKIPLCAPSYQQVQKGALLAYGFVHQEVGKQAAVLVNQILLGTKPHNLPIETANNYLVINQTSAKNIALEIPDTILVEAQLLIK